jgi:site-specific DNA-methyltransferase (adenine-specific)
MSERDTNFQEPTNPALNIASVSRCPLSVVYLDDCVQGLKRFADNYFDLAIVDPPYGIGMSKINKWSTSKKCLAKSNNYKKGDWDNNIPDEEYFLELFRVSRNQIIWGGNYYAHLLPASPAWIVWDKENDGTKTADCEMAWTSFESAARIFRWMWRGFLQDGEAEKKIHICQKPVKLYEWLLINYAKEGQKILDTHLGSGSSRIAAYNMKFDFVGFEIDVDHFNDMEKRFKNFTAQQRLF